MFNNSQQYLSLHMLQMLAFVMDLLVLVSDLLVLVSNLLVFALCISPHFHNLHVGRLNTSHDSHVTRKRTHIHVTTTMCTAWLEQTTLSYMQ